MNHPDQSFKPIFDYSPLSILIINKNGTIVRANPLSEITFGYTKEELENRPIEMLVPEALQQKHIRHSENYFKNPKPRVMGLGLELIARRKNGEFVPVEISLGYCTYKGDPMVIAFIADITQRKQNEKAAEAKLQLYADTLEQKVQERTLELTHALEREKQLGDMKSRFVSMASHEFRTPLSTILSSIYLVERYKDQDESRQKHIDRIRSSVKNLTFILNDFLSLDKLEQQKVTISNRYFNLAELCEDIIDDVKDASRQAQSFLYRHEGNKIICQDSEIVRNLLLNLISNAVKYSREGKNIEVTTMVNNGVITIIIKDYGIGIPAEDQQKIFTKFFRASNVNHIQGTGLGLNIVKRYLELLDGSIDFNSQPGEGSEFTVILPARNCG